MVPQNSLWIRNVLLGRRHDIQVLNVSFSVKIPSSWVVQMLNFYPKSSLLPSNISHSQVPNPSVSLWRRYSSFTCCYNGDHHLRMHPHQEAMATHHPRPLRRHHQILRRFRQRQRHPRHVSLRLKILQTNNPL